MRLVGIDEAWEQYSRWFVGELTRSPEGIYVFEGDELVAGCSVWPGPIGTMLVTRVGYATATSGLFMIRVLRAHGVVTGRKPLMDMSDAAADGMPVLHSSLYELAEEETPQARKKETDPGETPHAEPTDQGGTAEDVPPAVVESKPRAWRKKVKK